jgi:alpha/beta superfamily hydrolase
MCIAPPANMYDFNFLAPCPSSGLIIQGDKDQVVPQAYVDKLVAKLNMQKDISIDYRTVSGAGHFFTNEMTTLESHLDDYLNKFYQPEAIALAS